MIETKTQIRVRYAETDQMGVVYHANYAIYFEVARTDGFRQIGLPYSQLEADGVKLPVVDLHIKYHKSAHYDELLTIVARVREMPVVRLVVDYEIVNEAGELLCEGESTLVFMDMKRNRPTRMPEYMRQAMEKYF